MAEALVGGAFLSATLQVLFDRLASRRVLNLFRGPKPTDGDKLLRKLKIKLMELDLVLDDAERKQFTHQSVKNWLEELKDVVYHADDLLDKIATEALRLKVESQYQTGLNQVRAPISTPTSLLDAEFVSKIEEVVDSLEDFAKQKDVLGLKQVASQKWSHRLPSTSLVDESRVFGRESDKEEIIKLLVSNEQSGSEIDVIPIVGMGGRLNELPPELCALKNLKELNIVSCPNLLSFSSDGLPPALKTLVIRNCEKLIIPLSEEMEICCTSLESLELMGCDTLTHLPLDFFPKLCFLTIQSCDNLEALSISKGRGLQNLTSLQSVLITDCHSMVSFPQGGLPAPNLRTFRLLSCLKLKRGFQFPCSLKSLIIYSCPQLRSLPEEVPASLKKLSINHCPQLQALPEEVPASLKKLCIWDCPQLQALPEEVPASLQRLSICHCPQFQALPEKGLPPSLSLLEIQRCLLLKPRCQRDGGDDWHKIAHIPFVVIDNEMIS
ncbi:NB-ARC domain-containing disease resistance protein [Actinidia rufa]|uniref:NB-ARC domain-containing disease resistance protein n=1 Tax=Actinidia rufa TaxID=165716 RepID=A0A7J0F2T9_9ERIC|nr:NB-ARC domain-containing disease resistance protein [Actinidia rufa]